MTDGAPDPNAAQTPSPFAPPDAGTPPPAAPPAGTPAYGTPPAPASGYGPPPFGTPVSAPPPDGTPPYGPPPAGLPAYGSPPTGTPAFGAPPAGTPEYGAPPAGTPGYGPPPYGTPASGPPGYGPPAYGPPTIGTVVPASPSGGRTKLLWIIGAAVAAACLLVVTGALALRHGGSDRAATQGAPSSGATPAPSNPSETRSPDDTATGDASPGASSPGPSSTSTAPGPGTSGKVDAATASWLSATNAYCRGTTDPALKKASAVAETDPATYLTRVAAINRELDTLLRKNPPAGLRTQVTQVASDWDRMATLFDQAATAVRRGDRAVAGQLVGQANLANRHGNDLAITIGLRDCAEAGGIGVTATPSGPTV